MSEPVLLQMPRGQGMLCPVCRVDLVVADRMEIEIDYCPKCRGVWLDRGELDKIIERSMSEVEPIATRSAQSAMPPMQPSGHAPVDRRGYDDGHGIKHGGHGGSHGGSHGSAHRRPLLGRLFD